MKRMNPATRQLISPTGTHRHQMVHQFLQSDSGEYFPYQKLGSLNLIKLFHFMATKLYRLNNLLHHHHHHQHKPNGLDDEVDEH
ncbi:hypothetical protein BLOT_001140 [Blomia tropicalis]|nr:hypothetical protein BLOT_001140 [Blomia tropicalis]